MNTPRTLKSLWLDNEEGSYRHMQELAEETYKSAEADKTFTKEERAALTLADAVKEFIEEQNPLADSASMFADLMNAALGEVDWYEIAEHYLTDVDKEVVAE